MLHLRPVLAFILLKGKGGRDCHGFLFARRSPFPPETTAVASSTPELQVSPPFFICAAHKLGLSRKRHAGASGPELLGQMAGT